MVSSGPGKRSEDLRVGIRVSVVIRHKFWLEIRLLFQRPRQRCISISESATVNGVVVSS